MANALLIGQTEKEQLRRLRAYAEAHPYDARAAVQLCKTPEGLLAHQTKLNDYSLAIPMAYWITYTVEEQPFGKARHLSMSCNTPGRTPNSLAVWMIAQELGFWGSDILAIDHLYLEDLKNERKAVNILQRFDAPTVQ